jgi:hypothetical protein
VLKKWFNIIKKMQTDEHDNEEKVLAEYEDEIEIDAKISEEIKTVIKDEIETEEIKKEDVDIEELRIENEVECEIEEELKEESEIENNSFNDLENRTEAEKSEEAEEKAEETDESNELEYNIKLIEDNRDEKVFEIEETLQENDNQDVANNELEVENEEVDADFIKEVKIKRAKSIKAINIYTNENIEFKTHADCSRKLKVPLSYIKENILYGYTDYFGDAINYIGEQLGLMEYSKKSDKYLDSGKNPFETYKQLNDRIFSPKVSEEKRGYILGSSTIEPISMTYSFECLDYEYDDYFHKYKEIIKRTGKKKVELVKKNGDVLEVFKSIEECANYLEIDKTKVHEMLKCGDTKVDRNYIRYSFRKI